MVHQQSHTNETISCPSPDTWGISLGAGAGGGPALPPPCPQLPSGVRRTARLPTARSAGCDRSPVRPYRCCMVQSRPAGHSPRPVPQPPSHYSPFPSQHGLHGHETLHKLPEL